MTSAVARHAGLPQQDVCNAGGGSVATVDIAAAKAIAAAVPVRETETIQLLEADGRVLAREVRSPMDLPPFDNSAMDGYAVRSADFEGDGPWEFPVIARIAAGESFGHDPAPRRAAVRIFTGAPVPEGFNAVVMQEHCRRDGDSVSVLKGPWCGQNIRKVGEDTAVGSALLTSGETLTATSLALLAGAGIVEVEVFRRVRVGLMSTGSELRNPGNELEPGQIYNSNRIMLLSMLQSCRWADVKDFGIVPDNPDLLADAVATAAASCDVLVTTGGVSAGEEDHVLVAVRRHGAALEVLKVAMRPGKPLKIGKLGRMLFAGLPGNPNAALVTFRQIALPALRRTAGLLAVEPRWFPATAGFAYSKSPGRTEFVPVRSRRRTDGDLPVLEMLGRGSSASLAAMAHADGIALLPPEACEITEGMRLRYQPFHCS